MPDNWEYVAAAYGVWALTFAAYIVYLARRSRAVKRALRRLTGEPGQGRGSQP
jgi:hypothetical protein